MDGALAGGYIMWIGGVALGISVQPDLQPDLRLFFLGVAVSIFGLLCLRHFAKHEV